MDYFYYLETIKKLSRFGITAVVSLMIPLLLSLPVYSPSFSYMRAILLKPKWGLFAPLVKSFLPSNSPSLPVFLSKKTPSPMASTKGLISLHQLWLPFLSDLISFLSSPSQPPNPDTLAPLPFQEHPRMILYQGFSIYLGALPPGGWIDNR